MRDEDSPIMAWSTGPFGSSWSWSPLVVALGLSFWAQIFMLPLFEELRFVEGSQAATLTYLLPLAALLSGVYIRFAALILLVFPLCFVPGVLLLPERSIIELEQWTSMMRIGVTLAAYIGVAAASLTGAEVVGEVDGARDEPAERVGGIYPFYFLVRGLILLVLLVVTQYAVFQDPAVAEKITQHYSERPEGARAFIGLFIFFAWCVAAYTMFFVPLMNLEYDVRRLSRTIDEMADGGRRARWMHIGGWFLVAAIVVATMTILA
ncbi:MAG: hypothetical protein ACLFVJ_02025 [Persicimonas sp.]